MVEQRIAVDLEDLNNDVHPHCLRCIKALKCTTVPKTGESCNIITCSSDCGARFHACKHGEHRLLCMNEKVPCINAGYGCPSWMLRKYLSRHLISCPASIIHCSEEWDRWPIHIHDKKNINVHQQLDPVLKKQLDVALALRDQRVLQNWCMAANQGQPLSQHRFTPSSSVWIFRRWQNSRESSHPPGLEEGICKKLCKTCKHINTSNSQSACANKSCPTITDTQTPQSREISDKENAGMFNNEIKKRAESHEGDNIHPHKTGNEIPHFNLDDVLQLSQFGTILYPQCAREGSLLVPIDHSESYPYKCNGMKNIACRILDLKFKNPSSTPPWGLPLGLDLNLESRCQHSPSNFMYTFSCCQEFRRDEYGWHYRNVHSEIHKGLSGWLLERCPLAQYGCKFSRRRLNPAPQNSFIIYNESQESFGVTYATAKDEHSLSELDLNSTNPRRLQTGGRLTLMDLPIEVLQQMITFLDSFSLANLSLTSTYLREICASVLKEKGLVHYKWEKCWLPNGQSSWSRSKYKRWFFSNHFSPIRTWTMEEKNNMAHHLKTCPFFSRTINKNPFHYLNSEIPLAYKAKITQDNTITKL